MTSQPVLPSPSLWRVGIRISTFEACSGFTHVAARRIAQLPKATFVTRLRSSQSPGQTARQLPDPSTLIRVESSSTRETRLQGAHREANRRTKPGWDDDRQDVAAMRLSHGGCKNIRPQCGRRRAWSQCGSRQRDGALRGKPSTSATLAAAHGLKRLRTQPLRLVGWGAIGVAATPDGDIRELFSNFFEMREPFFGTGLCGRRSCAYLSRRKQVDELRSMK